MHNFFLYPISFYRHELLDLSDKLKTVLQFAGLNFQIFQICPENAYYNNCSEIGNQIDGCA